MFILWLEKFKNGNVLYVIKLLVWSLLDLIKIKKEIFKIYYSYANSMHNSIEIYKVLSKYIYFIQVM
jgi:hypothetical protein